MPRSDWGEIDGERDRDDTPEDHSDKEQPNSPATPLGGNTNEENKLQQIAKAIPTPTNLQPGNLFAPSIFMVTTTQTTTQGPDTSTLPMGSLGGKAKAGGSGPPGGGGGQGLPN